MAANNEYMIMSPLRGFLIFILTIATIMSTRRVFQILSCEIWSIKLIQKNKNGIQVSTYRFINPEDRYYDSFP